MQLREVAGYTLAALHILFIWGLVAVPFFTRVTWIMMAIIVFELSLLYSWRLFEDRCPITIIEGSLLGDAAPPRVRAGKVNFFNYQFEARFGEELTSRIQAWRSYTVIGLCAYRLISNYAGAL
jgi:hypothetical protein